MTEQKWQIYCITEGAWTSGFQVDLPTVCFNDPGHTVNPNSATENEDAEIVVTTNSSGNAVINNNFEVNGFQTLTEVTAPATPAAGSTNIYANGGDLFFTNSSGDTFSLTGADENENFYDAGPISTSSNSYVRAVRFTTASLSGGTYRIAWAINWNMNSKKKFWTRVQVDDTTTLGISVIRAWYQDSNGDDSSDPESEEPQKIPLCGFKYVTLAAGTHNIDIDFHTQSRKTVNFHDIRAEIWKITS